MQCVLLLLAVVYLADASSHPAKDIVELMRRDIPADPIKYVQDILSTEVSAQPGDAKILIAGDSWANIVGSFGPLPSFLERKLKHDHGCNVSTQCIAIPGTETGDWASGSFLTALKLAARGRDYVYIMLMGNDALDKMPDCASTGKTAAQCGDQLMGEALPNMEKIVDAIHEVNPTARVVGFGYDTMFGDYGCRLVTHDLFPQCWKNGGTGNRCFNTQFLRIQGVWDSLAANRSFVDSASILGATQVAGGDTKASTDPKDRHIDMDKMGPGKYWPDYLGCFHPGPVGGENSGAMVTMEEFYKVYWSKKLTCAGKAATVV